MRKVLGVGINDADYKVSKTKWIGSSYVSTLCPYYDRWRNMLRRCYDEKFIARQPK